MWVCLTPKGDALAGLEVVRDPAQGELDHGRHLGVWDIRYHARPRVKRAEEGSHVDERSRGEAEAPKGLAADLRVARRLVGSLATPGQR